MRTDRDLSEGVKVGLASAFDAMYSAYSRRLFLFAFSILKSREDAEEVVRKLNRWFNVNIVLQSPQLNKYVYTATYREETLNQILELLTISAPIRYCISDRERQSDNSYSKRKIVLTKRKI